MKGMAEITTRNFMSATAFRATYHTKSSEQVLVFESRTRANRETLLFTMLDNKPIRVASLQDFVLEHPDCIELAISHSISIVLGEDIKPATLIESFVPSEDKSYPVYEKLTLLVDEAEFSIEPCTSLTDAWIELSEVVEKSAELALTICFTCRFAFPAFEGPIAERTELRCHRDVPPDVFETLLHQGKFAKREVFYAGDYCVTAFHTCAAWRAKPQRLRNNQVGES